MDLDQVELGALIRKRRKELGLTMNDLASELISIPTISNIERGITHNVREEKLAYIKERLGLTDEEIEHMLKNTKKERQDLKRKLSVARHLIQLKLYEEARKALSELEDEDTINEAPYYSISVQLLKGIVYYKLRQWERAKRTLQKVLRLAQESDLEPKMNVAPEANYFLSLCSFYADQDYEKAIEYADSALDGFEKDGDKPYLEGQILYDKANYHFHLGRYASAYKYVMEARRISEKYQDIRLRLLEYNLEGLIHKRQQQYENAVQIFEQAINLAHAYYPEPEIASVLYLNLGDTYYHAKAYEEAIYFLDIAYNLCQLTKDETILAIVYYSYGEVYYETKDMDKANAYIIKATDMAKKFSITSEYLQLLVLKAKIALENRAEEVETVCGQGIELASKSKLYTKQKEFHFILAKYYDKCGNKEQFLRETEELFRIERLLQGEVGK